MAKVKGHSKPVQSPPPPPPKVVIKKDSVISQGIANAMGGLTVKGGLVGGVVGAGVAVLRGSHPVIGAVAGGALAAGTLALFTKGVIVAADTAVNSTIWLVKLPFVLTGKALGASYDAISAVYNRSVSGTQKDAAQAA